MSIRGTHLKEELAPYWHPPVVVLGVGRRGHGDDAAGPLLIDRLPGSPGLVGIDCGTVPENLLGVAARCQPGLVLLVDAVHMGASPGSVCVLAPADLAHTGLGTHALTPAMLLEAMGKRVGTPCLVVAVEPEQVGPDLLMSPAVSSALAGISDVFGELATESAETSQGAS
jgi:hydrogenase maturation protease